MEQWAKAAHPRLTPWTGLQVPSFCLCNLFPDSSWLISSASVTFSLKGKAASLRLDSFLYDSKGLRQLHLGSLLLLWSWLFYFKPFLCFTVQSFNKHIVKITWTCAVKSFTLEVKNPYISDHARADLPLSWSLSGDNFSPTKVSFFPQRRLTNIWRYFWLSQLGGIC